MKDYLHLLRIKHYVNNILVFIPMFFGGAIFDKARFLNACIGFMAFSFSSSVIYILNDYKDIENDRKHPKKCKRPLASGAISKKSTIIVAVVCIFIALALSVFIGSWGAFILLLIYLFLNLLYSLGLKKHAIIDVIILASGFVIRVFYGGLVTGISISKWLYLVVVTGSLYMGLGKRRNELRTSSDTREVLKLYNESFLDKNMYVCVALVNVFYALWSIEMPNQNMIVSAQ